MARFSAFLDACVLVPIMLTDTLLRLADAELFRPLWSESVLRETLEAAITVHADLQAEAIISRMDAMRASFEDACVMGWEGLVPGISLPDPDDRHVVAAALKGRADVIVTFNAKDFPVDELQAFGIEVQHPDNFLLNQLDLDSNLAIAVLLDQAAATRRPAITPKALVERLARCGVPRFAAAAGAQLWRGNVVDFDSVVDGRARG